MYRNMSKEDRIMIIMDVKIDNLYSINDFHMNMSYPKKISNSSIDTEYLENKPNFRYKKLNIIMGGNATGKTSFGKVLMQFLNYMRDGSYEHFIDNVGDPNKRSFLKIDFVTYEEKLYRFEIEIYPNEDDIDNPKINSQIYCTPIKAKDSYESCANRFKEKNNKKVYLVERKLVKTSGWYFSYPIDSVQRKTYSSIEDDCNYLYVLQNILQVLDPSIKSVIKVNEIDNTYAITLPNITVLLRDGEIVPSNILSSGTKAGIDISYIIASLICDKHDFYYCDELFSYVNSDIEKMCLSIIIDKLTDKKQFFFTTHNTNILDMQLPKHSFTFLKKVINDNDVFIKCIDVSQFLNSSKENLRYAVENDLFCTAPDLSKLYTLEDINCSMD